MKLVTIYLTCILSCRAQNLRGVPTNGEYFNGRKLQDSVVLLDTESSEAEASIPTSAVDPPEEFVLENSDPPAPYKEEDAVTEEAKADPTVSEVAVVTPVDPVPEAVATTTNPVSTKDASGETKLGSTTEKTKKSKTSEQVPASSKSTPAVKDPPAEAAVETSIPSLEAEPTSVTVVAPVGAYAGMVVKVESPDGRIMQVKLPASVKAGQKFNVAFPPINYKEKVLELFGAVADIKKIFDILDINHDNVVDATDLAKAGIV